MNDDVTQVQAAAMQQLAAAIMAQTGLSLDDTAKVMQRLTWKDIDLTTGAVRLPRQLPNLSSEGNEALRRWNNELSDHGGAVFGAVSSRDDED